MNSDRKHPNHSVLDVRPRDDRLYAWLWRALLLMLAAGAVLSVAKFL